MSLRRSVIANFASQIYVTAIGILMLPMYLTHLGAEAYGLVGFYASTQAWSQLLDTGLSPTMARQSARFKGGAIDSKGLHKLLARLELIFAAVGIASGLIMFCLSESIATKWLVVEHLPLDDVRGAVRTMGAIVGLRLVSGLYRGALTGFEKLAWLGFWNSTVATIRFVAVVPFFIFVSTDVGDFFLYQLGVALIELSVLIWKTRREMPGLSADKASNSPEEPLGKTLSFSLSIAFTSSVWILITQTDRLVLSRVLPLKEYGYFTLAALVSNGVMALSGPISSAVMPRMTLLHAQGQEEGMLSLYRKGTQLVAVIAVPAAMVLAFFPQHVLYAWTADQELVNSTAQVLTLYALGNGILAVAAFPYYLQFAKGDLRLHILGNIIYGAVLPASMVWSASRYGMLGAGWSWLISTAMYFVVWIPVVHRQFARGLHLRWVLEVASVFASTTASCWLVSETFIWPSSRAGTLVSLVAVSAAVLLAGCAGSPWLRGQALATMLRARPRLR